MNAKKSRDFIKRVKDLIRAIDQHAPEEFHDEALRRIALYSLMRIKAHSPEFHVIETNDTHMTFLIRYKEL